MKKHSIGLVILIFLLIYYPPIIKFNTLHIVGFISWIILFSKNRLIFNYFSIKRLLSLYVFFAISIVFVYFLAKINNNSLNVLARFLFWSFDIIPICLVCVLYFYKHRYKLLDVIDTLLFVGIIQSICAIITYIFPDLQKIFIDRLISFGYKDMMEYLSSFRMYGISSGLNFSTPIYQSFLTITAIYLAIKKNIKYVIYVPFLLFSALINARSSLAVLLVGLILIILNNFNLKYRIRFKVMIKSILLTTFLLGVLLALLNIIKYITPQTYEWINTGVSEIKLILQGNPTGYFEYVTNTEKYILPRGASLWLGTGANSLETYGLQSDVGWVNDIWSYGIIYTLILYSFFVRTLIRLYKTNISNIQLNKFLATYIFSILIMANFKGIIFSINEVITIVFVIYLFVFGGKENAKFFNNNNYTSL